MIQPRAYDGASDLEKLIAFTAAAYGECGAAGYVHVGEVPHFIYNALRRHNPADLVHLWEDEGGRLLGWTISYPRVPACDFQVHPDLRGSDLEHRMLDWLVERTLEYAKQEEKLLEDALIIDRAEQDTIRGEILIQHGFTASDVPSLVHTRRPLSLPIPDAPLPEGFTIRSAAGDHEAAQLAEVHSGAFNSNWTPELYQKLMNTPGYDVEREMVVVAPDGRFAAFCIYWLDQVNKTALFEPVGTHKDFHRMGLGRALMYATMHRMIDHGMEYAEVNHEFDNPASTGLYAALGFQPVYKFYSYRKAL